MSSIELQQPKGRVVPGPLTWWAVLMAATLAAIYAPVVRELWHDWWTDDNYSHGVLVPAITAFLLWNRREEFRARPLRLDARGLLLVAPSLGLLLLGTAGAEYFLQRVSLVGLLGGLVWFGCGAAWARLALLPVAFLFFAIPVPYVVYYSMSFPLQQLAARVATFALDFIGVPATRVGNTIELPGHTLEVAEACSGLRSLVSLLALGALFARFSQDKAWKRWFLFACTVPVAIAGNALRVFATGLGVYSGGGKWAEGALHEAMGMAVFAFAMVALAVISAVLRGLRMEFKPPPVEVDE